MYRCSDCYNPARTNRGFSLLEVLVALAIAALSLGVLLNLFAGSSRSASLNQEYRQALQLAESKLDEIASNPLLWLDQHQGEHNQHYRWQSQVTLYNSIDSSNASSDPSSEAGSNVSPNTSVQLLSLFELYQIKVSVSWGTRDDYPVSLTTLRLGERS